MSTLCRTPALTIVALTLLSSDALAQPGNESAPAGQGQRRVTLTRTVEPSFHIEPIVQRFEARRGEKMPFSFLVKSTGKSMDVTVQSVNLRQEESGIILHDAESDAAGEIQFSSPMRFQLAPGESQNITGVLTVPLAKSNYLSYGILVRDTGQVSGEPDDASNEVDTNAKVRFVTQYVLRVDIETGSKDLSEMERLKIHQGEVVSERGMPVAQAYLENPTTLAFECLVRGTIESETSRRPTPFPMGLPSRENLLEDQRYLVRVMPGSRVRLRAPVEQMLFPGDQTLSFSITNGRRAVVEQEFPIRVSREDFPALQVQLAYVSNDVSVEPAQIQVGRIVGADRTQTLKFSNTSKEDKQIQLALVDLEGNSLEQLRLSSNEFNLRGGRTKTVRATLTNNQELTKAMYGIVKVQISQQDGSPRTEELPLAMLYGKPPTPVIDVAELQAIEKDGHTSFVVNVTNATHGFVPVTGNLRIADEHGHVWDLTDGYGRWFRSGETKEFRFSPRKALPAGDYQLTLSVQTSPDQEVVTRTLVVTLNPEVTSQAVTSSEPAQPTPLG